MKWLKFVFVVVLFVFSGSCKLFIPTTYYYVVSSSCPYHGTVKYATPAGLTEDNDCPLLYFATRAYRFPANYGLVINAYFSGESGYACYGQRVTVTIMKGGTEGSIGSGGTAVATQTGDGAATATAVAGW
jgi:hypothetical protein